LAPRDRYPAGKTKRFDELFNSMNSVRITPESLKEFATDAVSALGANHDVAEKVAESLVTADLRGHNSHGIARLSLYRQMVEEGAINPGARPRVEEESATTATVDGRSLFGQVVGRKAVSIGVEKAIEEAVSVVGVRDATHLGRIGEWGERTAAEGLVFAAFVNTQGGAQTVTPPGSADRLLSTNPLSIAIPTFDALPFDIVLDMATSQVANGKIYEKRAEDERLPAEWTTTSDGTAVSDPDGFIENEVGALLPLGGRTSGYKGFGLSVVVELLASSIADGTAAGETDPDWFNNAACFVFIDPLRFTSQERLEERVTAVADRIRSASTSHSVPADDAARGDKPMLPGEPEHEETQARRRDGIPIPATTRRELNGMAAELGIDRRIE
jgi:uncharacterized oxidoreductase